MEKREVLKDWAEAEGVTVTELLGFLLHLENYQQGDRGVASIGWQLFTGEKVFEKPAVTVEESTWMIEKGRLSQTVWEEYRLRLLGRIYLPPLYKVRAYNQQNRPTLTIYRHGVRAQLDEVLLLSLMERLEHMDLSGLDKASISVLFKFGWGLDGSGEHSDYRQLSKRHFSTKQVMSVAFSVNSIIVTDKDKNKASWSSTEAGGANRPQNVRPLAVFPSAENKELLEDFVPQVEAEVVEIKKQGLQVKVDESEVQCKCEAADLSMADGKMVSTLLRIGGAFCTMCTLTQAESQQIETIEAGFIINRSVTQLADLAMSLMDPDSGDIIKKKGDYQSRQGVCGLPITSSDLCKNIPVCHAKIRMFEFVMELLIRYLSHKKWYTPTNGVKYSKEEKRLYEDKRKWLQTNLNDELAINIGNAAEMVTGRSFQQFTSDHARQYICSLVEDNVKEPLNSVLLGLAATVKVLNSQKRRVNIQKLQNLTTEVHILLVTHFPWVVISPSVHRILAHSWERIELNGGFGLGDLSEEGLESINKFIREMRNHGARKESTEANFKDVYNHLWDRSRPTIVDMERAIKRRKPKVLIATEIEAFVESLFLEEDV